MGLDWVKVEEEYGRASGSLRISNSGQSCPDTTTTLVHNEEVLHPTVKISSPSPLMRENPGAFRQEPPRTESAGSRAYDVLSHAETEEYATQKQYSGV